MRFLFVCVGFVCVGEMLFNPDSFTLGAIALDYRGRSLTFQSGLLLIHHG
ncbi:MAG: hypothetical protein F6K30_06310 [Cyanothece sp. SIO2G6]|nr:hypothetical protein [Cyanothece sp. SIO2G6]